jgi:hypothetical protein
VKEADMLATQLAMLVDGAISMAMVRDDPSMARAAASAARMLLASAGIKTGDAVREPLKAAKA